MTTQAQFVRRILLVGPLPPPLSGTTVSFNHLVHELTEAGVDLTVLDTVARGGLRGQIRRARMMLSVPWRLRDHDLLCYNGSWPKFLYVAWYFFLVSWIVKRPLVLRPFGGGGAEYYKNGGWLVRKLLRVLLSRVHTLWQTKASLEFFLNEVPGGRASWFPTSRVRPDIALSRTRNDRPIRFVFLSQVRRDKGVFELLEATRALPPGRFTLSVYGPLQDGISCETIESVHGVTYGGLVEPDRVLDVLQEYDVLLLPTYYPGEGYPGTIIESFVVGMPVIATEWAAIPEIVVHGYNGLLIQPQHVGSLTASMRRFITEPHLLDALGANAYETGKFFMSERWNRHEFLRICEAEIRLHGDAA